MRNDKRRLRRSFIGNTQFNLQDLDYRNRDKQSDQFSKAQNIKAAQLILAHYYEREVARNMPKAVTGHAEWKKGSYLISPEESGRPQLDTAAPPDWPFSQYDWNMAVHGDAHTALSVATAYIIHERERLAEQHRQLYDYGVNALDPEQTKRLAKTREKEQRIARRNWRERNKRGEPDTQCVNGGQAAPALPYVSSSDPYADLAMDLVMDTVVEVNWND